VTAVLAALFGLASAMGFVSNALLVIPIVGIILGIVALVQINRSNGTQTGRAIAVLGLVLSLGIGGWVIGAQIAERVRNKADEQEIAGIIDRLGQTIKDQKPQEGYQLFGGTFPARISPQRYEERMSVYHGPQAKELWGDFVSLKWNGHTQIEKDPTTQQLMAVTVGLGSFTKAPDQHRYTMIFRKTQSGWIIEGMPDLFPVEQRAGGPGGPGGPGGGPPGGPAGPPAP
jgi:hypothetical protein